MAFRQPKTDGVLRSHIRSQLRRLLPISRASHRLNPAFETLESRTLLATNIGAVRPDTGFANNLLAHYLDTQPLATGDANPEITFHYGFSATSNNGVGLQGFNDYALGGDLSGIGFDQSVVVRPFSGALQWLGDTDRDTTQEYLFRFGLADMTPLVADMNGDGVDDVIAVDTTTASDLLEWYVHYGVPGNSPLPTDDSTLSVDATFSFGVDADHAAAVGGLADIPQVGDINGDGRADVLAVRRGASTKDWFISYAQASYPNNTATVLGVSQTISGYGANAATPVIGDWDNDGDENVGVVDDGTPSTWSLDTNGGGAAEITKQFGLSGDQYIVGRWADVLWDGAGDGDGDGVNWSNANNWSAGVVPTTTQSVVIDQPGVVATYTVSGTSNAGSINTNETLSLTSGTLTITGNSFMRSGLTIAGGTLATGGVATLRGTSTWSSGGFSGAGSISQAGTMNITAAVAMGSTAINNSGNIVQTGATVTLNSSTINNLTGASYVLAGNVTLSNNTGVSNFNNAGTFLKNLGTGSSTLAGSLSFNNQGGTVQVDAGTLSLRGGTSTGGTFITAASATLNITGGQTQNVTGTYTGTGSGSILVSGLSSMNVGAAGATFNFASGLLTVSAGGSVQGTGTLTNTGMITFDGTTTVATAGVIDNQGSLRLIAGQLNLNTSTINIQSGGTFEVSGTGTTTINNNTGTSVINNAGTFYRSTGAGTTNLSGSLTFNNLNGTIVVDNGTLNLRGGTSTGGTYNVSAGATLNLTGGQTQTFTGTHTGVGAGAINLTGTINAGGGGTTLNFVSGLLRLTTGGNFGTGTINNTGFVSLTTSTSIWGGATFNNPGTFQQSGGQLVLGTSVFNSTGIYALSGGSNPAITASTGSFNNSGQFNDTQTGAHGITATFSNTGTVSIAAGTFTLTNGNTHSGSFSVANASTLVFTGGTSNYNTGIAFSGIGTVQFGSGTHNVNSDITLSNLVTTGTLSIASTKTVSTSSANLSGGTVTGAGSLSITGTTTIATSTTISGNVTASGTWTITGNAQLSVNSPGVLTVGSSAVLNLNGTANPAIPGSGTVNVQGQIVSTGTSGISVTTYNTSAGSVIRTASGTLALPSSGTHSGTFTADPGAAINITNGTMTLNSGASFGGGGTISLNNGTYNVLGDISGTGMNLNFGATFMNINSGATFTLNGTNTAAGANLNNNVTSTGALRNTGTLTVSGAIGVTRGSLINDGTITSSTATATVTLSAGALLQNNSSAVYVLASTGGVSGATGSVVNNGILRRNGTGTAAIGAPYSGSGTIETLSGTLDFQQASTFGNTITTSAAAATRFTNAAIFNFNTGTAFSGTGTISFTAGTSNINDNITSTSNVVLSGATLNVASGKTFSTSGSANSITGGALSGSGTLLNSGTLSMTGGSLSGGSTLRNTNAMTLTPPTGGLTQAGTLQNAGSLALAGIRTLTLSGASASILNEAPGIVDITGDADVVVGANTSFLNQGTLRKSGGAADSTISGTGGGAGLVNQGVVEIQTGSIQIGGNTGANVTHTGSWNLSAGATLLVNSGVGTTFNAATTFTGSGTLSLASVTATFANDTSLGNLTATLSQIVVGAGKMLTATGTSSSLAGSDIISGSVLRNTGTMAISLSGLTAPAVSGQLRNAGLMTYSSSLALVINATGAIINESTGNFRVGGGDINGSGVFTNEGTVSQIAGSGSRFFAPMTNSASGVVDLQTSNLTITNSGTQSGTFNSAAGTILTFRNAQTISSAAVLNIAGTLAVSGAGTVTVQGNRTIAALDVPTTLAVSNSITVTGATSLSGSLAGPGTLTTRGAVSLAGSSSIASGGNLVNQGTITLDSIDTFSINGSLQNEGTISLQRTGSSNNNISGTGTFLNTPAGVIQSDANVIAGISMVVDQRGTARASQGTLRFVEIPLQHSGTSLTGGTWVANNATIEFSNVAAQNITTLGASATVTFIGAASAFAKFNTLNNIQGTFSLINKNFAGAAAAGVTSSGTVTLDNSSYSQGTFNTFTQTGGTTTLSNLATFGSTVNLNGGIFAGSGTITAANFFNNSGTVSPGASPGVLNFNGNYVQGSGGVLDIEIGGTETSPPAFDRLEISGSATLAGTLNVQLINNFLPDKNDAFRFMTFASRSGNFSALNLPQVGTRTILSPVADSTFYDLIGNTLFIRNLDDTGAFSLRNQILSANSSADTDYIYFTVPGVISLESELPAITRPTVIDGTNVAGYVDAPLITLNGSITSNANGLIIRGSFSQVRGLSIVDFQLAGILIDGGASNVIAGNYIGLDDTGAGVGNGGHGVLLSNGATNNIIGGSTPADRNVISAQAESFAGGVTLIGVGTSFNKVQGNYIGTDAAGSTAVGNEFGVFLFLGASDNTIGVDGDGINDSGEGNLISGNVTGIYLQNDADDNVIAGNWIGLDATGTSEIANTSQGIRVLEGTAIQGLRIGTNSDGISDALEGNVIAASGVVNIWLPDVTGSIVAGNYIGTDINGMSALGSTQYGIVVSNGSTNIRIGSNSDGVLDDVEGNLISGHTIIGVNFSGIGTSNNTLAGNKIGINSAGTAPLPNLTGVQIENGATSNTVGGALLETVNVISGNTADGIWITGSGTNSNVVAGNIIGLIATGDAALGNGKNGIAITAGPSANIIGGSTSANRNIISGNSTDGPFSGNGVFVQAATGNRISGNFIGLNLAGTAAIPNYIGVQLYSGADGNFLGTNADGNNDAGEGNKIAGSVLQDLMIYASSSNIVSGNYLGSNASGTTGFIAPFGIRIAAGSQSNIFGYTGTGDAEVQKNYVLRPLIAIENSHTKFNRIAGNSIGVGPTGSVWGYRSVSILQGGSDNFIGTNGDGLGDDFEGNVIVGSILVPAITISDSGTDRNVVAGNKIGIDAAGTSVIANHSGITIQAGAKSNRLGTDANNVSDDFERNIVSGSVNHGINIDGVGTSLNTVAGNYVGLNSTGGLRATPGTVSWWTGDNHNFDVVNGNNLTGTAAIFSTGKVKQAFVFNGANDYLSAGNPSNLRMTSTMSMEAWIYPTGPGSGTGPFYGGGIIVNKEGEYEMARFDDGTIRWAFANSNPGWAWINTGFVAAENAWTHIAVTYDNGTVKTYANGALVHTYVGAGTIGDVEPTAHELRIGGRQLGDQFFQGKIDEVAIYSTTVSAATIQAIFNAGPAGRDGDFGNLAGVILSNGAANNTIGGSTTSSRNVISGNRDTGVIIAAASNNTISGNSVGTDVNGNYPIANAGQGILLSGGSTGNTIGGTTAGRRNIISGNSLTGIMVSSGTPNNVIQGNYIGVDTTGTKDLGNGQLTSGGLAGGLVLSSNTTVGGLVAAPGNGPGNVISGNFYSNFQTFAGSSGSTIQGNIFGLGADGSTVIDRSGTNLIQLETASVLGGAAVGARNIVSGGKVGVDVRSPNVSIEGNYIGTEGSGQTARSNDMGIRLSSGINSATIIDNVISGYTSFALNTGSHSIVQGNRIGVSTINTALGGTVGIIVDGSSNLIGGTTAGDGNVIGANIVGLTITGYNNQVMGNYVGTNASGSAAVGNNVGMEIGSGSGNTIGGSQPGAGNVISGNVSHGVSLISSNLVAGTVAWWSANGTTNSEPSNYSGALQNGAGYATGLRGGQAFNLDGVDDYVQVTHHPTLTPPSAISLSTWFTAAATGQAQSLINKFNHTAGSSDDSYALIIEADGKLRWQLQLNGVSQTLLATPATNVRDGQFHHVAATYDGAAMKVFIDGQLTGTLAATGSIDYAPATDLLMGAMTVNGSPAGFLRGKLEDVAIINRALSGSEVTGLFQIGGGSLGSNTVQGNTVGLNAAGTSALANGGGGILVFGSLNNDLVNNTVSGNSSWGINLLGAHGTTVRGNYVGLNRSGTAAISNLQGINVASSQQVTLGGVGATERNVISGNIGSGVAIAGVNSLRMYGNYVGLDATGTQDEGNGGDGVFIADLNTNITIGGSLPGQGNVISGNSGSGILAGGPSTIGTKIEGNFIGTNAAGNSPVGNSAYGIRVNTQGVTIGGATNITGKGAGNVISGNLQMGVAILASQTTIAGNIIGLDSTGTSALGNQNSGVGHLGSVVGTTIGGSNAQLRNVIAGNAAETEVSGYGAASMTIEGNYIGTDITGTTRIAGSSDGIHLENHASGALVRGNLISGYLTGAGIRVNQDSDNAVIVGNKIGTDGSGTLALSNSIGIYLLGASGVFGLDVDGTRIGTDGNGIGDELEGNVIAGNGTGILVTGEPDQTVNDTVIAGNLIGFASDRASTLGNSSAGIRVTTNAFNTLIGGDVAAESNWIGGDGIGIDLLSATTTTVIGNRVGIGATDSDVAPMIYGIRTNSGASNNAIGGSLAGQGNRLANTTLAGLRLEGNSSGSNSYLNNFYTGNLGLAIDAGTAGATLNENETDGVLNYPVVTSAIVDGSNLVIIGFAGAGKTLQFYSSGATLNGIGQGSRLLSTLVEGSAADLDATTGSYGPTVNGRVVSAGVLTANAFRFEVPLPPGIVNGSALTALAVGSTSEFSPVFFVGEIGSTLAPQVTLETTNITTVPGESLSIAGSFYDPDSNSWTATVDYGDGSGVQSLALANDRSFQLQHIYASSGNFVITVRVVDETSTSTTRSVTVTIQNEAPTATFNLFSITSPVQEGQTVQLTGQFEDSSGSYSATIDWGDGATSTVTQTLAPAGQIIALGGNRYKILATHTYRDDSNPAGAATASDAYRVVVSVSDGTGVDVTPSGLFLEEVRNGLPSNLQVNLSSLSINEGQSVLLSGSFVDAGLDDTHKVIVDWGDGTQTAFNMSAAATATRNFSGLPALQHVYPNDPTLGLDQYIITVSVSDDDQPESAAVVTRVLTVNNVVPFGLAVSASSQTIFENQEITLSGSFIDPGVLDAHTIDINWGDGSSVNGLELAAGQSTFSSIPHRYLDNAGSGPYTITVSVRDTDSTILSSTTLSINVMNSTPQVGAISIQGNGAPISEGDELTITGTYTDASPADRHTVLVTWGDTQTSLATVDPIARTFTATHRYMDNGTLGVVSPLAGPSTAGQFVARITVSVTDDDGAFTSASTLQSVDNVAPSLTVEPANNNNNPNIISLLARTSDPGLLDAVSVTWQAFPAGIVGAPVQTGLGPVFSVDRSAYPNSVWRVNAVATDDDGGSFAFETALLVGSNGSETVIINDSTFSSAGVNKLLVLGLGGDDILDGTQVTSTNNQLILDGGDGTDNLFGGTGDDIYYLWRDNDSANVPISGGPTPIELGSDTYRLKPNSILSVIDRSGDNTLDFSIADFGDNSGILFDLSLANAPTLTQQSVSITQSGHLVRTLGSFNELVGSNYGDRLTAASSATIAAGTGHDQLTVKAGTTNATLSGGADNDTLTVTGIGISDLTFSGDAGSDTLLAGGSISDLLFNGGADADKLINTGSISGTLVFGGDAGLDSLLNEGTITSLEFGGGADNDLLQNLGSISDTLNFLGDAGADIFLNAGDIGSLSFAGGADGDLFINNGSQTSTLTFIGDSDLLLSGVGQIDAMNFSGDSGADIFVNLSDITSLTFSGGADNDLLINNGLNATELNFGGDSDLLLGAGSIGTLNFFGDFGNDQLQNLGSITDLTFQGGADNDVLQNAGTVLESLLFSGDVGSDALYNTGNITSLNFAGGADNDLLVNNGALTSTLDFNGDSETLTGIGSIDSLSFMGDAGADTLINLSDINSLGFMGGADSDLLVNVGEQLTGITFGGDNDALVGGNGVIETLFFGGDAGADVLRNTGSITDLTFGGGADSDLLINQGTVTGSLDFGGDADVLVHSGGIIELAFGGDRGADSLINLGQLTDVNFIGGADNDLLRNEGSVSGVLSFVGDSGADSLLNTGTLTEVIFTGGADGDQLINIGTVTDLLNFGGDAGRDTLQNNGQLESLLFGGGADGDLLVNRGTIDGGLVFGGDSDLLINGSGEAGLISLVGDGGADQLINLGTVDLLQFTGGADGDVLQNSGTVSGLLSFTGDAGQDQLVNRGGVGSLDFTGGADNDILVNLNSVEMNSLTFSGGADNDVLINYGNDVGTLTFLGDAGSDALLNDGSHIDLLSFTGGADNDLLISNGQDIFTLNFIGDEGVTIADRTSNDTMIVRGSGARMPGSTMRFDGGYGLDAFENNATGFAVITFSGGADGDTLLNNADMDSLLNFVGDAGNDVLVNHGAGLTKIDFDGGADRDVLVNDGVSIVDLTFSGGGDSDLLINSGHQLGTLDFNGGADSDTLANSGDSISLLTFEGGADNDLLINDGGLITTLEFGGDAGLAVGETGGDDRLLNRKSAIGIGTIRFHGDVGNDVLINDAAGLGSLNFSGDLGSDALQNNGQVSTLEFQGGADDDFLVNAGGIGDVLFVGGGDDDALVNRGFEISEINFLGDAGADSLINGGVVDLINFTGGADNDTLQNTAEVTTLNFFGDAGSDVLVNNSAVTNLQFEGGADGDVLQNNSTVDRLTFLGGGDSDSLVNNGNAVAEIFFSGDAGADTLINNGSDLGSLNFTGGADNDTLRIHGRNIGDVTFHGGADTDSFTYNAIGTLVALVAYYGDVGSSRVDLQACKLEYSIVSPK